MEGNWELSKGCGGHDRRKKMVQEAMGTGKEMCKEGREVGSKLEGR